MAGPVPWHWLAPLIVLLILLLIAALLCFCKFPRKNMTEPRDPHVMLRNVEQAKIIRNPSCQELPLDNTTSLKRSNNRREGQNGDPAACENVNEFDPPVEDSTETEGEVDLGLGSRNPGKILPHVAERHKENVSQKAAGDREQDEELLVINLNYEDVSTMQEMENDITDTSEDAPMIPSFNKKK